jgi:hypothetical protein
MTPNQQQLATYQAGNREAASIVLADPAKFGGEESLLVQWATAVLAKTKPDEKELSLWGADDSQLLPSDFEKRLVHSAGIFE